MNFNSESLQPPRRLAFALLLGVALLGLSGCETVGDTVRQQRLTAHPTEVGTLTPAVRARVEQGGVQDGDTFEAIFLALGTPDYVETSADGMDTLWRYEKFYHHVTVNGAPVFPTARKAPGAALPPKLAPLRGSSLTTDEYARQNSHNGSELPPPPRTTTTAEPPPLPAVELEIQFRGRTVAAIQVTRDEFSR